MAIEETKRSISQENNRWRVDVEASDGNQIYNIAFYFDHEPESSEIDNHIAAWIDSLEKEQQLVSNPFNHSLFDELLNYAREVLRDCVLYLRENDVSEEEFIKWFTTTSHPQSIFDIYHLLPYLYSVVGASTFEDFIAFVRNNLFVEVDE